MNSVWILQGKMPDDEIEAVWVGETLEVVKAAALDELNNEYEELARADDEPFTRFTALEDFEAYGYKFQYETWQAPLFPAGWKP